MKVIKLLLFVSILNIIFPSDAYSLDKETLWCKITFADDLPSVQEAQKLAYENPAITEELLFISDMERDNSEARNNCLVILEKCSLTGVITKDHYFSVVFRLLSQLNTYVQPRRLVDEKKTLISLLGNYGESQTDLLEVFSTLVQMLDSMMFNGLIRNEGVLNSLKSKIVNAKEFYDKKGINGRNAIVNKIESAINEANAQKGKHLTEEAATIFVQFCQNLIIQLQAKTQ